MHIAHFTNTYHPVVSGVVRSVSAFRKGLTELGHNVFIFAQYASDYEDEEPFIFRYPAIDLPMANKFPLAIPISPFIDKLLPSLKLDAIHTHHPFLLGQTAANKAEELDVPLVFTYHTRYREYSHYVSLNQDLVKKGIDRWLGEYIQKCHHLVVPSNSIKSLLEEEYGVYRQMTVIPTGIDLDPYQAADRQAVRQEQNWNQDTVLISVGRLAEEKNWRTLLAAVARIMEGRGNLRLVLIGDGEDRKSLEEYTRELDIAEKVEFTGQIPFDEVPRYLKGADLFCFASVTETQGLVTMEAMAAELPVVAVDATGTSDVLEHNQEGYLTENDAEALAQAMAKVLDDEEALQRFREAAKEKAVSLSIKAQTEKLVQAYQQALEDKQAQHTVPVDKQKKVFNLIFDEEQWRKWFGSGKKELVEPEGSEG